MNTHYEKLYSSYLGQEAEFKVFGTSGRAVLAFPCRDGRFFDWENEGMISACSPWIECGKIQVFCVDSFDFQALAGQGDSSARITAQERLFHYICDEFYPRMQTLNQAGCTQAGIPAALPMLAGCDLGATHAAITLCRRPQLFGGMIALSGFYRSTDFFDNEENDLTFRNSPCDFVAALPKNHPQLLALQKADPMILCAGQAEDEGTALASAKALQTVFEKKAIPYVLDIWGNDVTHDWNWWRKEWRYFLEKSFGAI